MTETRLRAFADQAERLVDLPDVAALERRGRTVRTRRRAAAVGVAALVVAGAVVAQKGLPHIDGPDQVDTPGRPVVSYPGNQMHDLAPGTYQLFPSSVRGEPTAILTLPSGWNSWEGPNRFDGHRASDATTGRYNERPLSRSTWYVGVLVVKVLGVGTDLCLEQGQHPRLVRTADETVDALVRVPGYRVLVAPERVVAFGRPATHLTLGALPVRDECGDEAPVFVTSANGAVGGESRVDVWVTQVDGVPVTVVASTSGEVPARYLAELRGVLDSIEIVPGVVPGEDSP